MKTKKPIAIIISVVLLIFGIVFLTASITSNKHQKSINESDRYLSDIFLKQTNSNNIIDIRKYNSDIRKSLTELDEKIENLRTNTLIKVFFSKKIRESENLYTDLKTKYTEHTRQIDLLAEYLNSDINRHYDFVNSYNNLVNKIKTEINSRTPIEKLQELKNSTSIQRQLARRNIPKINEEINKTEFEGDYEKMRLGIYTNIQNELVSSEKELQTTENKFDNVIRLYSNHSENLETMSRQILSQSQGINTIYHNISPMSRELQSRVQPVREAIRTIEQPIISTGPFGRDVTALSLINAFDPMTGRTITGVRDFCDVVLNITDNINKLGEAIEPLRQAASDYLRNPNRQNAIALNDSSIKIKNYLNDQKGLFDPISQRINSTRNQINDFNRAVSNVRISQARDLLYRFSGSTINLFNYTEVPIRAWQSNIDATNTQFYSINRWEDDYISAINAIVLNNTEAAGSAPEAAFNTTPTTDIDSLTVNFIDQSTNTPTSLYWEVGEGTTHNLQNRQKNIYFLSDESSNDNIYVGELTDNQIVNIQKVTNYSGNNRVFGYDLCKNTGRIAYVVTQDGRSGDLYLLETITSNPILMPNQPNDRVGPLVKWSPNGNELLFSVGAPVYYTNLQIAKMNIDGSNYQIIINNNQPMGRACHKHTILWLDEGMYLGVTPQWAAHESDHDLWFRNSAGTFTKLTNTSGIGERHVFMNPNASTIVFGTLDNSGRYGIRHMSKTGGTQSVIIPHSTNHICWSNGWLNESTAIYTYRPNSSGTKFDLYLIDLDGSDARNISNNPNANIRDAILR